MGTTRTTCVILYVLFGFTKCKSLTKQYQVTNKNSLRGGRERKSAKYN